MPFDGNGNYTLPSPAYPAVPGSTITAAHRNSLDEDIRTALSNLVTRDGQSPPTANLPMASFRLTGHGESLTDGQPVVHQQVFGAGGAAATGGMKLPVGTTAQRPASTAGFVRLNNETGKFEGYSGAFWGPLGGGATGAGGEAVFWENEQQMDNDYTITAARNAGVWGPLTIASTKTLTVGSGDVLIIV